MAELSYEKALERISRICSRQEKSSYDVVQKLQSWEVKEEDIVKILKFLKDKKFVDDARYARAYTYNQHHFRKWGRIKIQMILRQKQIPEATITEALKSLDEKAYLTTLKKELIRKGNSIKAKNRYDLMARLQRFAYSRGYEQDLVREVMDEVLKKAKE